MNPKNALDDMRTIKQLLTDAESIARELGEREPAAEHLLLSAIGLPDGTAGRALAAVGVDAAAIRAALVALEADALVSVGVPRDRAEALATPQPLGPDRKPLLYGAGPTARDAFRAAGEAARRARQRLRGAHVVIVIADIERGTIARVLDRLGVDRDVLRAAASEELRAAV
jgi:ATP-dependent Clp protease ATP-binding subunit ClpA